MEAVTVAFFALAGCPASSAHVAAEMVAYAGRGADVALSLVVVSSGEAAGDSRAYGGTSVASSASAEDLIGPRGKADPGKIAVAAFVLPVVLGPLDPVLEDRVLARELRRLVAEGCVAAATCDAVFVLASAGLLDGKAVPVHPSLQAGFRRRFPAVRVDEGNSRMNADGIICSVGAGSFPDLLAETIRGVAGNAAADRCARIFLDRSGAARIDAVIGDDPASRAAAFIEKRYTEPLSAAALAEELGTTERTLSRRFERAFGLTPTAYLRARRCAAAASLLKSTDLAVEEIAWRVGYSDASAFARAFRSYSGSSPAAHRAGQKKGVQTK